MAPSARRLRIRGTNGWFPPTLPPPHENAVLTQEDLVALEGIGQARVLGTGDTMYEQDGAADMLFLVQSGIVRVSHLTADGNRHILAFHWQGDVCGLMEDGRYVNSAVALCETHVLGLPRVALQGLLLSQPLLQNEFLVKVAADLRKTQRLLIALSSFDAPHKMASFLLECTHHEDHYDAAAQVVTLFADRKDIADYLGLSGETVSRALGVLAEAGLIRRISTRRIGIEFSRLRHYVEA